MVIESFEGDKRVSSFVNLDFENFYPSFSTKLLTNLIKYAKYLVKITDKDPAIRIEARKTLLFQNAEPWVKIIRN